MKQVIITAPTGTAAANICASTYQSTFYYNFDPAVNRSSALPAICQQLQQQFKDTKILIIDELSFINDSELVFIEDRCRAAKTTNAPFGGMSVVLFGDIAQLPPVTGISAWLSTKVPLWRTFDKCVELDHVYRQQGASEERIRWRELLLRLRTGESTVEDWEWLQQRSQAYFSSVQNTAFESKMFLFSTREANQLLKIRKLTEWNKPVLRIVTHTTTKKGRKTKERLYSIGVPIRLECNLWLHAGLYNGCIGTVRRIL